VYSRDQLPIIKDYPSCFILNTDTWLAIYYDDKENAEFFDPAGYHPNMYRLEEYLESTSKSWIYNDNRIQGFFSK